MLTSQDFRNHAIVIVIVVVVNATYSRQGCNPRTVEHRVVPDHTRCLTQSNRLCPLVAAARHHIVIYRGVPVAPDDPCLGQCEQVP